MRRSHRLRQYRHHASYRLVVVVVCASVASGKPGQMREGKEMRSLDGDVFNYNNLAEAMKCRKLETENRRRER